MNNCSIKILQDILQELTDMSETGELYSLADIVDTVNNFGLSLKDILNSSEEDQINDLKIILKDYLHIDYTPLLDDNYKEVSTINNIPSNFRSSNIQSLFHTMQIAENYFQKSMNEKIIREILLGRGDKYVSTNEELSKNIKSLKNELFNTVRKYLKKSPINLYKENGALDIEAYENNYTSTLKAFEDQILLDSKIKSPLGNKIPNLRTSMNYTLREKFDAYNAAVMLINFDNVIESLFGDIISIDKSVFNNFADSPTNNNKYKSKIKGISELYWKNDDQLEESVERSEAKLSKLVVEAIRYYDRNGNFNGQYMELKDFYSFAALLKDFEVVNYNKLKSNFEDWIPFNEDSEKALVWYINKITDYYKNRLVIERDPESKMYIFSESFHDKYDFIKSLSIFFKDYNIDEKQKTLENENGVKGLLTQIINNSVGATYYIYNASKKIFEVKDLFKQNMNVLSVQEGIYAYLKTNSSSFSKEKNNHITTELDKLLPNKIVDNDSLNLSDEYISKVRKYFKQRLGIILNFEDVTKMFFELASSKNNKLSKDEFIAHLKTLDSIIYQTSIKLFEGKKQEVTNFESDEDSDSHSQIISDLLNLQIVREIINRRLDREITKPIMNIETLTKEKIPVYKLINLSYNDVSLMRAHEKHFSGKNYKNIFVNSDKSVLLGTGTKLEIIKGNNNTSASNFSIQESTISSIVYDFYKSIGQANRNKSKKKPTGVRGFSIMLGNYSDKSTILTKIIDPSASFESGENAVPIIKESFDNLLDKIRTQSANYYKDLFTDIFNQYNLLFSLLGRSEKLEIDFSNKSNFKTNIDIISKYLAENDLQKDLSTIFKKEGGDKLRFIEEVHYSTYNYNDNNKSYKIKSLNQLLIDYYNIFNDKKLFDEFVKDQENEFIIKYKDLFKSEKVNFQDNQLEGVKEYLSYIGEDYDNYAAKFKSDNNDLIDYNGEINPLIKKWMWVNALFRNEYMFMSGKGEYLHPHKRSDVNYRAGNIKVVNNKIEFTSIPEVNYSSSSDKFSSFADQFKLEMTGRLINMAKRNVAFTSTFELPARKSRFGVPENINLAVIEDYKSELATYGGITKNQDIHDGSSKINYIFSKLVNASYPSKGYKDTKKQFGTLITEFGAIVKKDAETVITNNSIRDSHHSEIKLREKQYQMLSIPIGNINFINENSFDSYYNVPEEYQFIENGNRYRILKYKIENGVLNFKLNKYTKEGLSTSVEEFRSIKVNNLFDIWESFGGEYSVDADGNWSEGSNELLYNIVTSYNEDGNYILKDKMIHIISNKSAIKSGSTNLNSKNEWTNPTNKLMYSTYEYRHMGPQLDASHDSDASEVREITQVISALAQNMNTAERANDVYKNLAKIIENAAKPYQYIFKKAEEIENLSDDKKESALKKNQNLYEYVAKRFFESIVSGGNVSLARTIIESFPAYIRIPYSNQNFFNLFVKNIISQLNDEFISRYYSGIGAVLNPSHGIIQIYEDNLGNVFTYSDIAKIALSENTNSDISNDDIINNYISEHFGDKLVDSGEVVPNDTVIINGELKRLNTIDAYYKFKKEFNGQKVIKSLSTPRDLKPSEITFGIEYKPIIDVNLIIEKNPELLNKLNNSLGYQNEDITEEVLNNTKQLYSRYLTYSDISNLDSFGSEQDISNFLQYIDNDSPIRQKKMNIFDLQSVRLRYTLEQLFSGKEINKSDKFIITEFAKYFNIPLEFKILSKYLNAWTQRNLDLLEDRKILKEIEPVVNSNGDLSIDFSVLFGNDDLITNPYDDVKNNYNDLNTNTIYDYSFKAAELILPNIYKSDFGTKNDSIADIKRQGVNYFKSKLDKIYDSTDSTNDIEIVLSDNRKIYVRYVESLPAQNRDVQIVKDVQKAIILDDEGNEQEEFDVVYNRVDEFGNKLYTVPENAIVKIEDGKEIILIKAFEQRSIEIKSSSESDKPKRTNYKSIASNFNKSINSLISSFDGKIIAIVPLMNTQTEVKRLNTDPNLDILFIPENIHNITLNIFKYFSGFVSNNLYKNITPNWLSDNKEAIISQLSNKIYASWKKSHEFVAARIPAQSLQSFMEMKNVSYYNTESNDAYVSVFQILLQGSDFDIDKAYIIGYGFDKNSAYETASNAFNYATKEQLDLIEQLPSPSLYKHIKWSDDSNNLDLSNEFLIFLEYANKNLDKLDSNIYSEEVLLAFKSALEKINKTNSNKVFISPINTDMSKKFLSIINSHNKSNQLVKGKYALKNSIVHNIKSIVSSPTNQLLANSPVDVDELRSIVEENSRLVNPKYIISDTSLDKLSSWDMISMFKQQYDASVGKKDVGIAANGLKVFFALSNYYNMIYTKDKDSGIILSGDNLRHANHTFLKTFYLPKIYNDKVEWEYKTFTGISDSKISKDQLYAINEALGSDSEAIKAQSALMLSSFTSAATDNAKELLMAKMNANVELASMHLYMLSLGIDPEQVVYFMTSEVANLIVSELNSNLFSSGDKKVVYVNVILDNLIANKELNKQYGDQIRTFKDIYNGAQEFKALAKIFKINQSVSANTIELYNYLYSFNSSVYAREKQIFSTSDLKILKSWQDIRGLKEGETIYSVKSKIAKKIISNNPILQDTPNDIEYIIDILDRASSINYNGEEISLIGGQFDFRKYFDWKSFDNKDSEYKKLTKEYYNLIKNTINIFDVVDNVPHFKAMIDGLVISHNILLKSSKKYNFVFNKSVDLNKKYNYDLVTRNSHIKSMYGDNNFPIRDTDRQIRRRMLTYDKFLFSKWAKSYKLSDDELLKAQSLRHISKFSFNVSELLELADIKSIILLKSDEAASSSEYNDLGILNTENYIEIRKNDDGTYTNDDFTVDLLSDTGIANFKLLMENVIIEILKKDEFANDFVDSLRIQSVINPYDILTNQIVASFNLSQLNNPISIEKFQNLLSDFNSLESIKRINNINGDPLNWRDLFYVYNLAVNNDAYGDKRLTPLFEDYIKERDSVAFDFLLYSSKVDSGEIDIFEIDESKISEENNVSRNMLESAIDYSILYALHNDKGVLKLASLDKSLSEMTLQVTNPNYVTITNLTEKKDIIDKLKNIHTILNWIKSNSLVVTFKCD